MVTPRELAALADHAERAGDRALIALLEDPASRAPPRSGDARRAYATLATLLCVKAAPTLNTIPADD